MRFVTVLAAVILLVGCSQAAPSVEKQHKREAPERIEKAPLKGSSTDLPAYDITLEQDCAESGIVGKCYGVSTDATSREELEVITADLWLDSPGYLAVLVTFYPNKPTADLSAAGFAFENEQAAALFSRSSSPRGPAWRMRCVRRWPTAAYTSSPQPMRHGSLPRRVP